MIQTFSASKFPKKTSLNFHSLLIISKANNEIYGFYYHCNRVYVTCVCFQILKKEEENSFSPTKYEIFSTQATTRNAYPFYSFYIFKCLFITLRDIFQNEPKWYKHYRKYKSKPVRRLWVSYSHYTFWIYGKWLVGCLFLCVSMTFYIEVESDFHQVVLECLYKFSPAEKMLHEY